MVTTVYVVRHGETDYNLGPRYQGQLDIPLNANGRRQGDLLGQAMKNHHIDAVFSSPLGRAMETGRLIAQYHDNMEVTPVHGLEEIDVGVFEGKHYTEAAKEYPEIIRCVREAPAHIQYPQGECTRDVFERVSKTISEIVDANRGKTIVIVSHGFAIQNYIHYTTGKPLEEMGSYIVTNTSRSKFVYEEGSLMPETVYLNKHDHLAEGDFSEWLKK